MILTGGKRRKGANSGPGDGVSHIRHHTRETTMRAFVRSYIQAEKARREEASDKGFSLIELIVVVVILGVLAAVAIPVFLGIQGQAEQSAVDTVTANAASQAAAALAQDQTIDATFFDNLETAEVGLALDATAGTTVEDFCVIGTPTNAALTVAESGPGC
jgi:type IV pilus assembly protein PilA